MKNETFQFRRFGEYFRFDCVQTLRHRGRPLLLFAGLGLVYFVVVGLFSLIFTGTWHLPTMPERFGVFLLTMGILELYTAHLYGHLTDRKAGASAILLPASRVEKYVSMLLIALVVVPLGVYAGYMLLDALLTVIFPGIGPAIAGGARNALVEFCERIGETDVEILDWVKPSTFVCLCLLSHCLNFLFFLLCGLCFKKFKILGALVVMYGISVLLSLLSVFGLFPLVNGFEAAEDAIVFAKHFLNWCNAIAGILVLGLGWGVWRRLKTLQH